MIRLCAVYDHLKEVVQEACRIANLSRYSDDLTHDAIIVASCCDSKNMTDEELLEHFKFKLNEVTFQTAGDLKQNKSVSYADHYKAQGSETGSDQ